MNNDVNHYLNNNKRIILLRNNGKKPICAAWNKRRFSKKEIKAHKGNYGWALDENDLIVDVDPRNGGDKSFFKLCADLHINLIPTVLTPSGGFHVYLKCGNGSKLSVGLPDYGGINFLRSGFFVVTAGCKTESGIYEFTGDGFTQIDAPKVLVEVLSNRGVINNKEHSGNTFNQLFSQSDTVIDNVTQDEVDVNYFLNICENKPDEETIKRLINKLDPSVGYHEWIQIGMALHNWNDVYGLDIWESWSKAGSNYEEGKTQAQWKYFNHKEGGIGVGTLYYKAKEADIVADENKLDEIIRELSRIKDQKHIWLDIPRKLKRLDLNAFDYQRAIEAIQNRLKEITGTKPTKTLVEQKMLSKRHVDAVKPKRPEWCDDWVYDLSSDRFIQISTLRKFNQLGFNLAMGEKLMPNEKGTKTTATKFVSDNSYLRVVDRQAYVPQLKDRILEIEGEKVINTFNWKTLPKEAKKYTEAGLDLIKRVKNQVSIVFNQKKEDADIFIQWMAHQVQNPGEKIFWSPMIQGEQGIGKDFFSEILSLCLGDKNVKVISPRMVREGYNGWAMNACVTVFQELRIVGENRYQIADALKPMLTNRVIPIRLMRTDPFNTVNTVNYICFTNYKDAVPLENSDRRWWIIFSNATSASFLPFGGKELYFRKLYADARNHAAELRKWLLEVEITEQFKNMTVAPMTVYKSMMMDTEEANIEGLIEIKEMIETGGRYYNKQVVSSADLFDDLAIEHVNIHLNTRQRNNILKHLGYMQIGIVKIDGKARRIWSKSYMDNKEIRKFFDLVKGKGHR